MVPASNEGPLREFADGDESDREWPTVQPTSERSGESLLEHGGGDVGIEDERGHAVPERREA